MKKFSHQPVLLNAAVDGLAVEHEGIYVDGTFGRGGHASLVLSRLNDYGRLYAIDKDPDALQVAQDQLGLDPRFSITQGSFAMLAQYAHEWGVAGKINGVLLDLGVSSPQLDDAMRGFSFSSDGPLDMRMDPSCGISAADWLATAEAYDITQVLRKYGDERFAKRIAKAIVVARDVQPITTTAQLSKIISEANPCWEKKKHPATRSFQAIRIFINQELDDLERCLDQVLDVLAPGGRLSVISFHSLEDRIVKRFMRKQARGDDFPPDLPIPQSQLNPKLKLISKAIRASDEEVAQNPRARSAVLRVAEKVGASI